jgi:hypothetical protein
LKRIAVFLLAAAMFSTPAWSGFAAGEGGVSLTISYSEKRIYYLGDAQHPVLLDVVLTNNSDSTFRFKSAENRFYNLDFEVSTPSNQLLEHSQKFIKSKYANQPVFFRDISLDPGERFGITLNLNDFVEFSQPGLYTVQALFYPELSQPPGTAAPLRSNPLSLSLRPAVVFPEEKARIEAETGALLAREPLPPDEVVSYTLQARQRSQWEKFFLYLDLESLYIQSPGRAESYRRMSEENRRKALADFRRQLSSQVVDTDIALIPDDFQILQTSYTPFEATVLVTEKFKQRDFTEVKRYTYYLTRKDRIWLIGRYETVNLGTE